MSKNSFELEIPPVAEPWDITQPPFATFVAVVAESYAEAAEALDQTSLRPEAYIALGTALKCVDAARAGRRIQEHLDVAGQELSLNVVEPMYHEADRMSPRTAANPHGEDAFAFRLQTLDHIAAAHPSISTRLLVVDDGCSGGGDPARRSKNVATALYDQYRESRPDSRTEVVITDLDTLVAESADLGWKPEFTDSSESRKGGSVVAGFAKVLQHADPDTLLLVVDTDADLSIHPLQVLLLAEQIVRGGADAAVASRRTADAVALIDPARDTRGQAFIRSWQTVLPTLAQQVVDTNRGLKAYSAQSARIIVDKVKDPTFPYQIESLLSLALEGRRIAEVGVSYIDSVALSTQAGDSVAQTYDDQIERFRAIAERYGENSPA